MSTPEIILEALRGLPPHLRGDNRRFYVEAVSDETRAPMIEFYRQQDLAETAALEWAKANGADGFYPPNQDRSEPCSVYAFSFKTADAPKGKAWAKAGRGFVPRSGYVAMYPSRNPAGKALSAELAALLKFPAYSAAIAHLGLVTDLSTDSDSGGLGWSDSSRHYSVPFSFNERFFISAVNHNYDISQSAQKAAEYLAGDHPEWAPCLSYKDDPISWRPAPGWAFLTKAEVDFLIAEENLRRARDRAAA